MGIGHMPMHGAIWDTALVQGSGGPGITTEVLSPCAFDLMGFILLP